MDGGLAEETGTERRLKVARTAWDSPASRTWVIRLFELFGHFFWGVQGGNPPCIFHGVIQLTMVRYEHLPIYKKAMDVAIHFEKVVAGFSRYHRSSGDTMLDS